jgi:hypothetical protein
MPSILTTARLVCMSEEARELAIEAFRKIIAYTTPNEPGVLQYVCALPVDDRLGLEIYKIEEYVAFRILSTLFWYTNRRLTQIQIRNSSSQRRASNDPTSQRPLCALQER